MEGFADHTLILGSGVYALTERSRVVYIGKAKCVLSRVARHRELQNRAAKGQKIPAWLPPSAKGMRFDGVHVFPCRVDQMGELEAKLIETYRPQHNIVHRRGPVASSVTLMIRGRTMVLNRKPEPVENLTRRKLAC